MIKGNKHTLDVSCYVALGDSITAGYTDGALFYKGQESSYANLIAQQFKSMGVLTEFKQPYVNKDSVGIDSEGHARLVLKKKDSALKRVYYAEKGDQSIFSENNYLTAGPFHNMGVPGAKAITMVMPGYGNPDYGVGNYNPFFTRMASHPETASILSDALAMNPTFFSLYVGSNDVLACAFKGGLSDAVTPLDGEVGVGFESSFRTIVNALTAKGAKGVVSNISDIVDIPYFTSIPYNGLILNPENVSLMTSKYKACNLTFHEGKNPFVIEDALGIRFVKKGEFILLDILLDIDKEDFLKGLKPIPKKYILTEPEIAGIQKSVTTYNTVIKEIAQEKKLAFVDVNTFIKLLKKSTFYDENTLDINYNKEGNIFSLDAVHLNALGQALLANIFIKAINDFYGTEIPHVKMFKYRKSIF